MEISLTHTTPPFIIPPWAIFKLHELSMHSFLAADKWGQEEKQPKLPPACTLLHVLDNIKKLLCPGVIVYFSLEQLAGVTGSVLLCHIANFLCFKSFVFKLITKQSDILGCASSQFRKTLCGNLLQQIPVAMVTSLPAVICSWWFVDSLGNESYPPLSVFGTKNSSSLNWFILAMFVIFLF